MRQAKAIAMTNGRAAADNFPRGRYTFAAQEKEFAAQQISTGCLPRANTDSLACLFAGVTILF